MISKLTRRLFGIITVMILTMLTSLSANATCYLAGSATNWQNGKIEMEDAGNGVWTITKAFAEGETFKIIVDDTWYGMEATGEYWVTADKLNTGAEMQMVVDNQNLYVSVAGTYTLLFDSNTKKLRMGAQAPVTVKDGIANGTVTVNPTQAIPAQTVTITATPDEDHYIEVGNITVEKTISGGSAQFNATSPGVGQFITDIQAGEAANTFTFAMPESPYGAQVSAEFQARISITEAMFQPIGEQDLTGAQITPAVVCVEGYNLVLGTDYTVEYGENVGPGQHAGIVTITGIGKYKGEVVLYFDIIQGIFYVNIAETEHGTVVANPSSCEEGTHVVVTFTADLGYVIGSLTVGGEEVPVNTIQSLLPSETGQHRYSVDFDMPAQNVDVVVTFLLADYAINITQGANGNVTSSVATAHYGESVTLTATPAEDYALESLIVDGADVIDLVNNNSYTFTMPNDNVVVSATFRKLDVSYWVVWGITPEGSDRWESENWVKMNQSGDNYVLADQDMAAFSEFKIVKKVQDGDNDPNPVNTWYGAEGSNLYWITVQLLGKNINLFPNGSYANLYIPKDGTFTFTFTPATATTNAVLVV
ncbi:MAG: hypothetical protein J6S96_00855, partial [Muribaculaceae bacterium]|nr:hypothetical protein [Muribaculaceae bacterium]